MVGYNCDAIGYIVDTMIRVSENEGWTTNLCHFNGENHQISGVHYFQTNQSSAASIHEFYIILWLPDVTCKLQETLTCPKVSCWLSTVWAIPLSICPAAHGTIRYYTCMPVSSWQSQQLTNSKLECRSKNMGLPWQFFVGHVGSHFGQNHILMLDARQVEAVEFAIKSLALMRRDVTWQTKSEL